MNDTNRVTTNALVPVTDLFNPPNRDPLRVPDTGRPRRREPGRAGAATMQRRSRDRQDLPDSPSGWFAVATSAELPPGGVLSRRLCGHDLVVFRTISGAICVADAHCPHLGAHLGHGGRVEGETLRCPFHGFCFDASGTCNKTGYGTRPPPRARLSTWPVHETDGVVLVYHDAAGEAPAFRVPSLDWQDFSSPSFRLYTLTAHPQQTNENSVDTGHFALVHGFHSVRTLGPLHIDGAHLSVRYGVLHPLLPRSWPGGRHSIYSEFEIHIHGLGYSRVEVYLPALGIRSRQLILATPTGSGQMELRAGMAVRTVELPGPFGRLPAAAVAYLGRLAARLLQIPMMAGFCGDVAQDFHIWNHQRQGGPTALADGDGPIGRYRMWARQFYRTANPAEVAEQTS